MKQGEVIRKLRIERGLSQEALVKGISTRSTLSSFERRKTELTSSILLKYLERLNINFDEFQFLVQDNCLSEKDNIIKNFMEILEKETSKEEISFFLNQIERNYQVCQDNFYLMIMMQLKILKSDVLDLDAEEKKKAVQTIKEYLFKVESWCHFELTIFSNMLFIFDSEEIIIQFKNVISKMWVLQDKIHYNNLMNTFLINGCFLGFERNEIDLLDLFIRHLELVCYNSKFWEAKIYLMIFKGLYPSLCNQLCELKSVERGLKILDTLDNRRAIELKDFIFQCLANKGYEVCINWENDIINRGK